MFLKSSFIQIHDALAIDVWRSHVLKVTIKSVFMCFEKKLLCDTLVISHSVKMGDSNHPNQYYDPHLNHKSSWPTSPILKPFFKACFISRMCYNQPLSFLCHDKNHFGPICIQSIWPPHPIITWPVSVQSEPPHPLRYFSKLQLPIECFSF